MRVSLLFLGSGDAFGNPTPACAFPNFKINSTLNYRTRFSIFLEWPGNSLLIGAAPDLREQLLREKISLAQVKSIAISHAHYDQIGGLGEFDSVGKVKPVNIIADPKTINETQNRFQYLFERKRFTLTSLNLNEQQIIDDFKITSFELNHHNCFCTGFRLEICEKIIVVAVDTNSSLCGNTLELMKNADLLILDGLAQSIQELYLTKRDLSRKSEEKFKASFKPNERGHMLISEAIELSKKLNSKHTILTHLSHHNESHEQLVKKYESKHIKISYDGMKIYDI